ncbi:hypothetical protein ACVDG5_030470 [Mesorhizobium sp. ORM6]
MIVVLVQRFSQGFEGRDRRSLPSPGSLAEGSKADPKSQHMFAGCRLFLRLDAEVLT